MAHAPLAPLRSLPSAASARRTKRRLDLEEEMDCETELQIINGTWKEKMRFGVKKKPVARHLFSRRRRRQGPPTSSRPHL